MRRQIHSLMAALAVALGLLTAGAVARAGEADVLAVQAVPESADTWRFEVTVAHADTGWDHSADKWEVLDPSGRILGTRVLAHPHEDEQPFTRSLGGVAIAPAVGTVTVRAHDLVHGTGGREMTIDLPR